MIDTGYISAPAFRSTHYNLPHADSTSPPLFFQECVEIASRYTILPSEPINSLVSTDLISPLWATFLFGLLLTFSHFLWIFNPPRSGRGVCTRFALPLKLIATFVLIKRSSWLGRAADRANPIALRYRLVNHAGAPTPVGPEGRGRSNGSDSRYSVKLRHPPCLFSARVASFTSSLAAILARSRLASPGASRRAMAAQSCSENSGSHAVGSVT